MRARLAIGALGVLLGLFGARTLWTRQDTDQLTNAGLWLVGGVVLHDLVLAPVVLLLVVVVARLLPTAYRAPAVVALVVLGTLTIVAVPMLSGQGVRPDNPTLLPRDYRTTWLVLVAVVVVLVVVAGLLRSRRSSVEHTEETG
ncbi:MAG: hypothetical protein F2667_12645 [Actinobacteria bacterium]|uniref:Unannotated protein n=1 Tax=freshwater metagenome TaxID=449393 RepID=A0A6J6S013_9ZZZZ|nr:hypothetical protein [Actinomycetota bacterium]